MPIFSGCSVIISHVHLLQLYGSWQAVEGSHPGTISSSICSRTADNVGTLSWWAVDLTLPTVVSWIKVFLNSKCGMSFI